ncbi:MAG: hypothetical protein JKX88_02610, partial [Marinicaulis sp.]|nr:hypothetical protein [Marinicaulis sp.]
MGEHIIKLPDVGEGVAEAELVEWLVPIGANVREDDVLAAVMTDKATVEIPSPVERKIIWQGGNIGDVLAVGSPLIRLEVDGAGNVKPGEAAAMEAPKVEAKAPTPSQEKPKPEVKPVAKPAPMANGAAASPQPAGAPRAEGEKPLA